MKISDINESGQAADLLNLMLDELKATSQKTIDVTKHSGQLLWGAPVHIECGTYKFAVSCDTSANALPAADRARLLDLLCSARSVADTSKIALFEHWMCQGSEAVAVMHRFAVHRTADPQSVWLITQSNI